MVIVVYPFPLVTNNYLTVCSFKQIEVCSRSVLNMARNPISKGILQQFNKKLNTSRFLLIPHKLDYLLQLINKANKEHNITDVREYVC